MSICPYCRSEVTSDSGESLTCSGCGTPHHVECYEENKGCTIFGCKMAPPDDPKVEVTAGEVTHMAVMAGAPAVYAAATGFGDVNGPIHYAPLVAPNAPPPPPPPGSTIRPTNEGPSSSEAAPMLFASATPNPAKSRVTFILLGIFLGALGAHNFYAGYVKRGIVQLAITVCSLFYASFVIWIWAIVEVCTVDKDKNNMNFA
jgi:TM2 domain-containing membrane protein YozV